MSEKTVYIYKIEKLAKSRNILSLMALLALPFAIALGFGRQLIQGKELAIDLDAGTLLIFAVLALATFVAGRYVYRRPLDTRITISDIGVHFEDSMVKPVPWKAISRCIVSDELPPAIAFEIAANTSFDVASNKSPAAMQLQGAITSRNFFFLIELYERHGPCLAEQIRRHAPHLKPPPEWV
jgi:hypothetical protein